MIGRVPYPYGIFYAYVVKRCCEDTAPYSHYDPKRMLILKYDLKRDQRRMHTRTSECEVGVVKRTPRDEVVEQQYQPCLTLVKAVAQADTLLQYRSRLYGIDKSVDKL